MARHAVIFASNGPEYAGELQYAEHDADRLTHALSAPRCNFSVRRIHSGCTPNEVENTIKEAAQSCKSEDTFVVFFSGHGFIERGGLLLMLDGTEPGKSLTTAVHVESIMAALRYCEAAHKLLILDCCHAGMAFAESRFKDQLNADLKPVLATEDEDATSFITLLASDRLEKAREVDELGGSFMSSTISFALESETMEGDINGDGAIDIRDLKEWLAYKAHEWNRDRQDSVPIPFVYGRERGRLYLTRNPNDWPIVAFEGPNKHKMVPIRLLDHTGLNIWMIGTTPVTNGQYRSAVEYGVASPPYGSSFDRAGHDGWQEGFHPWDDDQFNEDQMPVVCIDLEDARRYAAWLNRLNQRDDQFPMVFSVTPPEVWDMAAFDHPFPSFDKRRWLRQLVHHKAPGPAKVNDLARPPNRYGVKDLFGNVWEWTKSNFDDPKYSPLSHFGASLISDRHGRWRDRNQELRGGGFLDDLAVVRPFLTAGGIADGVFTRHSDLGFRVAALSPLESMPTDVKVRASALGKAHRTANPSSSHQSSIASLGA